MGKQATWQHLLHWECGPGCATPGQCLGCCQGNLPERRCLCLQDEGFREMSDLVAFYRENAAILRKTFVDLGFSVYGGENAPYIWVGFPGKPSWDVFAEILEKCNIVTTPGSGFGPAGEGFVRASAFGHRQAFFLSLLPVCWEKRRHCEQPWQVMQTLCTTKQELR